MSITLEGIQKLVAAIESAHGKQSAPYILNMSHENAKEFIENVMKDKFSPDKKGRQKCGDYIIQVLD